MIPSVLQNLIDGYNEKGVFLINDAIIYWTNFKRIEIWMVATCNFYKVFEFNNTLFVKDYYNNLYIQKHNEFIYCADDFNYNLNKYVFTNNEPWNPCHPIIFFCRFGHSKNVVLVGGLFYNISLNKIYICNDGYNWEELVQKITQENFDDDISIAITDKCETIYCFSKYESFKFNIKTLKQSIILSPQQIPKEVHFYYGLFYFIYENQAIESYNPQLNIYQKIKLIIPKLKK